MAQSDALLLLDRDGGLAGCAGRRREFACICSRSGGGADQERVIKTWGRADAEVDSGLTAKLLWISK